MITQFSRWILVRVGVKNILYLALLLLVVGSSAYGLSQVIRGLDFERAGQIAFWGLVLAWLLAGTRLSNWVGSVFLVIVGVLFLLVVSGRLLGSILVLFFISSCMIWGYLHQENGVPLDLEPFNQAYADVYYGVKNVVVAFVDWVGSLQEGLPIYDDIAIFLVWGFSIWIVACWAGWLLRRYRHPVLSILPAGVMLVVAFSYAWAKTGPILSLVFASLSLIAMVNYDQHEERWLKTRMDYPEGMSREFGLVVGTLIVGLVALAAVLPIFSIGNLVAYVQQFTKPQIEEAESVIQSFGLNQGAASQSEMGNALLAGFPRQHLLGSGSELAETLVMTVKISGELGAGGSDLLPLPLYWRSLTYDEYTGSGWRSSDIILRSYKAGERVIATDSEDYRLIQIDVRMAPGQTRYLYAAGEIITAEEAFKIAYRPTIRYTEILSAHGDFMGASVEKSTYQVQSFIPAIGEHTLRNAPDEYPEWVLTRYLALPASLPARVGSLADELTLGATTPYDKIKRLEAYLRGYEYTLDISPPDLQQDIVDYFLFDLKKGYCDYYASAMVVMARSIGIPARLAIGYALGSYDGVNARYIVTEADAHSWVEVYFPNIGWIPFEPTAGRTGIERMIAGDTENDALISWEPMLPPSPWWTMIPRHWGAAALYFVAVCVSVIVLALGFDGFRLRRLPPARCIRILFQRLYRYGRILRLTGQKSETPWEFAVCLQDRIIQISQTGILKAYLVPAEQEIYDITLVYTRMIYSPEIVGHSRQSAVLAIWHRLRARLWVAIAQQAFCPRRSLIKDLKPIGED